jgi:hypothetical protein
MATPIDVSDISPARLLAELFNAAGQDVAAETEYNVANTMGQVGAQTLLNKTNFADKGEYFESIRGRTLRVTITGYRMRAYEYDKANGEGLAQSIVDNIRANP